MYGPGPFPIIGAFDAYAHVKILKLFFYRLLNSQHETRRQHFGLLCIND